ncbi:MAG: double-stranded DNA repair protein Rad50 [Candidatus Woesearchaeota archaeon]|nr:MAG: double-stranded DNA repair protein Rad50 [Candidatus Woesearchaeota archaeon]
MLLKSIRLNNIRSYLNQTIIFPEGATLLLGDIGSGKTTILLAIEFGLFGLIKGDTTGSTLLRHGKNEGSVELEFEVNGKDVKIMRQLKRKKDTISQDHGYIIIDNIKTDLTPIELKSKILEIFGYPEDMLNKNTSLIYRYTVYTPQEEMKNILFEKNEDRLDILRKIFNIDKYKRIRENALTYAKELRSMKKILEEKLVNLDDLKSKLENLITERDITIKNLENISNEISSNMKLLEEKNLEIDEIKKTINIVVELRKNTAIIETKITLKKNELMKAEKDINMISFRISEYENKIKDLGTIDFDEESLQKSLEENNNMLIKINTAKESLNEKLENKKNELKSIIIENTASLKIRFDYLKKSIERLESMKNEYESKKSLLDNIKMDINTLTISNNNSKKIIDKIKDLSVCPVCMQNVDFSHKIKLTDRENANITSNERKLKELEEKKKTLEKEIDIMKKEIEQIHKDEIEIKSIELKIQTMSELSEKKLMIQKEIEELTEKKEKLDSINIEKLVEEISKNRKILDNIRLRKNIVENLENKKAEKENLQKIIEEIKTELKNLSEDLKNNKLEIEKYSDIEKKFSLKIKEKEDLEKKIKVLEIDKSLKEKELEDINKEISKVKEDIDLNTRLYEKIKYIEKLNNWITDYFVALSGTIEKNIMHKIHAEFNELFKEWFSIIVQDEEFEVQIDENFSPVIRQNNFDTFIENLSGGEKTAVALSYRLALNKVINDFINNIKTKDLLILDEPTDGFSSEQLDRMKDVFEALNVKQLIIVSHEAKMESYAENIIKIHKNNHTSTVNI